MGWVKNRFGSKVGLGAKLSWVQSWLGAKLVGCIVGLGGKLSWLQSWVGYKIELGAKLDQQLVGLSGLVWSEIQTEKIVVLKKL